MQVVMNDKKNERIGRREKKISGSAGGRTGPERGRRRDLARARARFSRARGRRRSRGRIVCGRPRPPSTPAPVPPPKRAPSAPRNAIEGAAGGADRCALRRACAAGAGRAPHLRRAGSPVEPARGGSAEGKRAPGIVPGAGAQAGASLERALVCPPSPVAFHRCPSRLASHVMLLPHQILPFVRAALRGPRLRPRPPATAAAQGDGARQGAGGPLN